MVNRKRRRAPWWLPQTCGIRFLLLVVAAFWPAAIEAKERWTELNIGPFYVDTDGDVAEARNALTELEQVRWVMGGLLESKELLSLWPIRVMVSKGSVKASGQSGSFLQRSSQYLLVTNSGHLPLDEVAGLLLDANTPRLPPEVESGIRELFSTLEARGPRVFLGKAPANPDLNWARMQLFATKFDYGASFHIFLTALKGGSTFAAAERNAFGKPAETLEAESRANLSAGNWQAVAVSGRPLDPKRDLGEHALEVSVAAVYLADWTREMDPKGAEARYRAAIEGGGAEAALGYEGLGELAGLSKQDASLYWENAIRAGSHSAPVYVAAAQDRPAAEALPLLKRAAQLNPLWAEPVYRQAELAETPAEKELLLREAVRLAPRTTSYWIELAKLQTTAGEATAAQGSWLRAEDSAPDQAERERVHGLRLGSEQERLEAAEARRRGEHDAAHIADQQAQQSEAERIRAAEEKANGALQTAAGNAAVPEQTVPWNSLAKQVKLVGTLVRVDCFRHSKRLTVKDRSGKSVELLLRETGSSGYEAAALQCGAAGRASRIRVEYRAAPDDESHTAGEITSLELE